METYILTNTFLEGDLICHIKNMPGGINGFPKEVMLFFEANSEDVEQYSGGDWLYVKKVEKIYTENQVKQAVVESGKIFWSEEYGHDIDEMENKEPNHHRVVHFYKCMEEDWEEIKEKINI